MPNINMNISNAGLVVSLTSLSQILNTASNIDIVLPTTQYQGLPEAPRIPGFGKEHILYIAPDFNAPVEFGD